MRIRSRRIQEIAAACGRLYAQLMSENCGATLLLAPAPCGARISWTASGARCITKIITSAFRGRILGDFAGLPINDSARAFAESWDASRLTLQEHQCRVHVSPYIYHGPLHLRIWEEKDPDYPAGNRDQELHQHLRADAHHLDGRPSASARLRRAYLHGIFHRQVGRRYSDGLHHAHQAGLGAPQRTSGERPSHDDRAFSAARKHHDAHDDPVRSGLPDAAADSHGRFSISTKKSWADGCGRARPWKRSCRGPRARFRTIFRARTRSFTNTPISIILPHAAVMGGRSHHVSGVPEGAGYRED